MAHSFDKDIAWEIVLGGERLEQVVREIADQRRFAWDTETSGRAPWFGSQIIGHSFAWRPAGGKPRACYIPCRHRAMETELFQAVDQLAPELVTAAVKPILEGRQVKCGHNLRFDLHHAAADGIKVAPPFADTLVACKLIDERWWSYALDACVRHSGIPFEEGWKGQLKPQIADKAKRMGGSPKSWVARYGYQYLTIPVVGRYACQDATYNLWLAEWGVPQQQAWAKIWNTEMRLLRVVVDMERIGVPVDVEVLKRIADRELVCMAELEPKIWHAAGCEWELTNDNRTRKVLYETLGYEAPSRTPSGEPSIDDDALWHLQQQGKEIAGWLRKWNAHQKIASTYTMSIVDLVDRYGILHSEIDQMGAKTGRVSAKNPNLQNIPIRTEIGRQVREAFVCRPGTSRFCWDYSQIELRMLAHLSQDPLLLKIYREGLDAHTISALEAFGTAEKVDGVDMRRIAKILNFGVTFGMTADGLMGNVNKDLPAGSIPIGRDRAERFIAQFYAKYRGVSAYRDYLCYQVAAAGGQFRDLFGRPRRMGDGYKAGAPGWKRRAEERQTMASMVQGSTASLVKFAMVTVWDYLQTQTDCEANLVLMIHDDLQFDMTAGPGREKVLGEIKRVMEETSHLSVPVKCDCEWFDDHWGNKRKMPA